MALSDVFRNFVADPVGCVSAVFNLGPPIQTDSTKGIGHATSDDLRDWKKDPANPLLTVGDTGTWDSNDVEDPAVLQWDGEYHLFYSGNDGRHKQIGHATSDDLRDWEKDHRNPVVEIGVRGSWNSLSVDNPFVFRHDGTFHMFYNGNDGDGRRVGHATSGDLLEWEQDPANPVIDRGADGAWDSANVAEPSVVEWDGQFYLYYGGHDGEKWQIGCATSDDLREWERYPTSPLLGTGDPGEWDAHVAEGPFVAVVEDRLEMLYSGGHRRGQSSPIPKDVGHATALAPGAWEKDPDNPVLRTGPEPGWDVQRIGNPHLFVDEGEFHLFYTGWESGSEW